MSKIIWADFSTRKDSLGRRIYSIGEIKLPEWMSNEGSSTMEGSIEIIISEKDDDSLVAYFWAFNRGVKIIGVEDFYGLNMLSSIKKETEKRLSEIFKF